MKGTSGASTWTQLWSLSSRILAWASPYLPLQYRREGHPHMWHWSNYPMLSMPSFHFFTVYPFSLYSSLLLHTPMLAPTVLMNNQNSQPHWMAGPAVLYILPFTGITMGMCQSAGIIPTMASYYHLPFFTFSCDMTGEYHSSIFNAVPVIGALRESR